MATDYKRMHHVFGHLGLPLTHTAKLYPIFRAVYLSTIYGNVSKLQYSIGVYSILLLRQTPLGVLHPRDKKYLELQLALSLL